MKAVLAMALASGLIWTTTSTNSVFTNEPPIATISGDGNVTVNWDQAEKVAKDHKDPNWAYATLMIAIRDRTYKEAR